MPTKLISNIKFQISNFKLIASGILIFSLFTYNFSLIKAQTPIETAKESYSLQLTKYNDAREAYITAKSNYLAFRTATAKSDAFIKTRQYLTEVNKLILLYLALIRQYGDNTRWQSSTFDKQQTDSLLDEQTTYIKNYQAKVDAASTLEELPALAKDLKNQLSNSTIPKVNKVVTTFEIAQTESTFEHFNQLSKLLIEFAKGRTKPENQTILVNWQSEIANISQQTQNNINLSKQSHQKILEDRNNEYQIEQTMNLILLAKNELKRSKNLFEEILKVI